MRALPSGEDLLVRKFALRCGDALSLVGFYYLVVKLANTRAEVISYEGLPELFGFVAQCPFRRLRED